MSEVLLNVLLRNKKYASNFIVYLYPTCEPGSSVSIVSDYVLDDRAIKVRYPAEAKGFFL
jgi:hypothetical protein